MFASIHFVGLPTTLAFSSYFLDDGPSESGSAAELFLLGSFSRPLLHFGLLLGPSWFYFSITPLFVQVLWDIFRSVLALYK